MSRGSLCAAAFLLFFVPGLRAGQRVAVLDGESFDQLTSSGAAPWMVKFYAPWCKHSKALAPIWEVMAGKLGRSEASLAELDVTAHPTIAERLNVRGLPTIRLIKSGMMYEYSGPRKLSRLLRFARGGYRSKPRRRMPGTSERFDDMEEVAADDVDVLERNFYKVLGLSRRATPAQIKQAYRRLSLRYHPDKSGAAASKEKFLLVSKAYKVLSKPASRDEYDIELEMGVEGAATSMYNEDMDMYSALNAFSDIFDVAGEGRFSNRDGTTDWAKVMQTASAKFTGEDGEVDSASLGRSMMNLLQQFVDGGSSSNWGDVGQTLSGTFREILDDAPGDGGGGGGFGERVPNVKSR